MKNINYLIKGIYAGVMIGIGGIAYLSITNKIIGAFIFSIPFSYFLNVFTAIYINIPQNTDKINILNSLSFNLIIEISFATLLRLLNLVKLIKFPTKNAPIKLPIKVNSNSKIYDGLLFNIYPIFPVYKFIL